MKIKWKRNPVPSPCPQWHHCVVLKRKNLGKMAANWPNKQGSWSCCIWMNIIGGSSCERWNLNWLCIARCCTNNSIGSQFNAGYGWLTWSYLHRSLRRRTAINFIVLMMYHIICMHSLGSLYWRSGFDMMLHGSEWCWWNTTAYMAHTSATALMVLTRAQIFWLSLFHQWQ